MATHCRLHLGPALEEQNRARKLVQGLCYAVLASSMASSSLRSSSSQVETSWGSLPRGTLNLGLRKLILKGKRGSKTSILRRQAPMKWRKLLGTRSSFMWRSLVSQAATQEPPQGCQSSRGQWRQNREEGYNQNQGTLWLPIRLFTAWTALPLDWPLWNWKK